jgi:tRNA-specific 2-thiouridylase
MRQLKGIKIMVGMSGGVDSSVAAYLLQQQGALVEGLFMKNWDEDDDSDYCTYRQDLADAQQVADKLGIKLHKVNFAAEYWDRVFSYFLAEYQAGRTPNPDILCNKEIKFKAFLDYAQQLGADLIATGHYARSHQQGGHWQLLKGQDANKDQSYFLYALNQQQLSYSCFPLGTYTKQQVRQLAHDLGFTNHNKKDSTGICFIGERKFSSFLQGYLPAQPGPIVTPEGQVIGEHQGLMYYTIGQRRGLAVGGVKDSPEAPWYVAAKDMDANRLVVVSGKDHPLLYRSGLVAEQVHWINPPSPHLPLNCQAKIRYRQKDQACCLTTLADGKLQVDFVQPQYAIAAGQSVVFFTDELCLGGGVIKQVLAN